MTPRPILLKIALLLTLPLAAGFWLGALVPIGFAGNLILAAVAELLDIQARKVEELREAGVLVLDVLPTELSSAVINQYLDLEARHLL